MICRKNKIAFVHIPKCGGSSVESALFDLEGYTGSRSFFKMTDEQRDLFFVGTEEDRQHYTQRHIESELKRLGEDISEWRFLALVRDPFDRAVSEYFYQLATQPKLRDRANYVTATKAIESGAIWGNRWKHHSRSSREFLNGKSKVEVIRLENAEVEFPRFIKEWTGKDITLPVVNPSKKDRPHNLSQGARLMIAQSWAEDFKFLDYPIEGEKEMMSGWEKYVEYFNE